MTTHLPGGFQAEMAATTGALAAAGVRGNHGASLTETQVLGIGGGLGGGYFVFEYGGVPTFYLAFRHRWHEFPNYLTDLAKRLAIDSTVIETSSEAKARTTLPKAMAEGSVLAWVDRGHLPHRVKPTWLGGYYHHVVHAIKATAETITIEDGSAEPFEVPADVFLKARGAIKANKHRLCASGRLRVQWLCRWQWRTASGPPSKTDRRSSALSEILAHPLFTSGQD